MIVDCRNLNTAGDELCHHRADLGFQQHKITHHHDITADWLERDPTANSAVMRRNVRRHFLTSPGFHPLTSGRRGHLGGHLAGLPERE
jgi:hypothetical protein